MQLINTLPCSWKRNILEVTEVRGRSIDFCVYDNDLIKNSQAYVINKLNNKELYIIQHVTLRENLLSYLRDVLFNSIIRIIRPVFFI